MSFNKDYKGLIARSKMSQDELDKYYEMRRKVRMKQGKVPDAYGGEDFFILFCFWELKWREYSAKTN